MLRFGSFILAGQYRQATKFTTKMATLSISSLIIWSAYRKACIDAFLSGSMWKGAWHFSKVYGRWPPVGTDLRLAGNGIADTRQSQSGSLAFRLIRTLCAGREAVSGVVPNLSSGILAESIAVPNANGRRADMPEENTLSSTLTLRRVYNLSVEGAHCYFANGVLVHNCDSATMALSHLRRIGLAVHETEVKRELAEEMMFKPEPKPLYGAI